MRIPHFPYFTRPIRVATALISVLLTTALQGCVSEATAPVGAPYLAIVVLVDAPNEVTTRGPYTFRVREFSGTLKYDTTFYATPKDTVILSVDPATYLVEIAGVPQSCGIRDGGAQLVVVPPNTNTSLARFSLNCRNALTIVALTDGNLIDSSYVYTVSSPNGTNRAGAIASSDTLLIDDLRPGTYVVSLRLVESNCLVLNDGGDNATVSLTASGGATVNFRVTCSEPARRPRVTLFKGSYARGAIGFVLFVADPDKDVERYVWDVTDCQRHSILPGGARRRGGFTGWENVSNRDTSMIIGAYDLPIPDESLTLKCMTIYVADERGNTSEIIETPLVPRQANRAPVGFGFNATYLGTFALRVTLEVEDPNNDFIGAFAYYTVRDGIVILPADGQPDRVIFQPPGILGAGLPEIPFDIGYGTWSDYLSVTVYLVDRSGNFTRLEDTDLFR